MRSLGARWGFLQPWCEPLRGRLQFSRRQQSCSEPNAQFFGIRVSLRSDPRAMHSLLRVMRDALILLAMLRRVDCCAWREVLTAYCSLGMEFDDNLEELTDADAVQLTRFVFVLEENRDVASFSRLLPALLGDLDAEGNAQLAAAASQIASRGKLGREVFQERGRRVDTPIALEVHAGGTSPCLRRLWRSMKILQSQFRGWRFPLSLVPASTKNETVSLQWDCTFILEDIKMEIVENVTPSVAALIEEIATEDHGLTLNTLLLTPTIHGNCVVNEACDAQAVERLLERVLCASNCAAERLRAGKR